MACQGAPDEWPAWPGNEVKQRVRRAKPPLTLADSGAAQVLPPTQSTGQWIFHVQYVAILIFTQVNGSHAR
jgi:hypothetical protein